MISNQEIMKDEDRVKKGGIMAEQVINWLEQRLRHRLSVTDYQSQFIESSARLTNILPKSLQRPLYSTFYNNIAEMTEVMMHAVQYMR